MNKIKLFLAKGLFRDEFQAMSRAKDASSGSSREHASNFVKRVGYKNGTGDDFEDPDYDFEDISNAYDTDAYIRQGVDKYIDQILKEGYTIYGKDAAAVEYIKLRLAYIAEATQVPTEQLITEILEDFVKYGNSFLVKSRTNDPNAFPQGATVNGVYGGDPVGGYFALNPETMTCKRDANGLVTKWQQEADGGDSIEFNPEDVVHMYYKKPRGYAYGVSFLIPVLDDVRALRQAEENVLKMMYRNIYPFYHFKVGTDENTGSEKEVEEVRANVEDMDVEGGLVTTERVTVTPIASNQVIEAEPYLRYLEERVFSGLGVPAIMFGRGDTANRSTGDNMTGEMADRIRAISKTVENFVNEFIIKELLMEGGYDPLLNPEQAVLLKFYENDIDMKVKKENHAIYKYEHNATTESEMRTELGLDPLEEADRKGLFLHVVTLAKNEASKEGAATGTAETNNKVTPSNTKKTKSKDAKQDLIALGLIKDAIEEHRQDKSLSTLVREVEDILSSMGCSQNFKDYVNSGNYVLIIPNAISIMDDNDELDVSVYLDQFEDFIGGYLALENIFMN